MSKKILVRSISLLFVCSSLFCTTACKTNIESNPSSNLGYGRTRDSFFALTTDITDSSNETPVTSEVTAETVFEAEYFSLEGEVEEGENYTISYPIFTSQGFPEYQEDFNALLRQYAYNYWTLPKDGSKYSVTYEITGYNANEISILYVLLAEGSNVVQKHSLNLSLYTGSSLLTMEIMEDGAGWNASCIWDGDESCTIISEGVSNQELSAYLQSEYPDYDTFLRDFTNADNTSYVSNDKLFWTYLSDEGMVVLIPVSDEMGNYVEVKMVTGG